MSDVELLAPAGSAACFHAAASAGADAVYLGLKSFNARRGADNFTEEELIQACAYARMRGMRVYVALNTVVLPGEVDEALRCACRAQRAGADALIVQDVGLAAEIARTLPDMRLHVSTQMNVHSAAGVRAAADLGARRVTLARELSVAEIACLAGEAADLGIEVEVFAHGALCVCYSGQCLMSSMIGGRSANRGMCAQACRLPYELRDADAPGERLPAPGDYLLSPRDLCAIDLLRELADAGVASLKIEGRMKSPEYVASVASVYRSALDRLAAEHRDAERRHVASSPDEGATSAEVGGAESSSGEGRVSSVASARRDAPDPACGSAASAGDGSAAPSSGDHRGLVPLVDDDERDELSAVFSRGFTTAYLEGHRGNDIMSYQRPNNRGQFVGRVADVGDRSVVIDARRSIAADDVIEFWTRRGHVALTVAEVVDRGGERCEVGFDPSGSGSSPRVGDRVFRVRRADRAFDDDPLAPRIAVVGQVRLRRSQPLSMEFRPALPHEVPQQADAAASSSSAFDLACARRIARRLSVRFGDDAPAGHAEGDPVEAARTKEVNAEEVRAHVNRLGSTPFALVRLDIDLDEGVGIGFSQLHRCRAEALEELRQALESQAGSPLAQGLPQSQVGLPRAQDAREEPPRADLLRPPAAREEPRREDLPRPPVGSPRAQDAQEGLSQSQDEQGVPRDRESPRFANAAQAASSSAGLSASSDEGCVLSVLVANPSCAHAAQRAGAQMVYVSALNREGDEFSLAGRVMASCDSGDYPSGHVLVMPTVDHDACGFAREVAAGRDAWHGIDATTPVVVESLAGIGRARELGAPFEIGSHVPLTNRLSTTWAHEHGARRIWLSPELTLRQIADVVASSPVPCGLTICGAQELMVTEHCLLMSKGSCDGNCGACRRRRSRHVLVDRKGYEFPVETDVLGRSHLYNSVVLDAVEFLPDLVAAGVQAFMVDATLMDADQTAHAVSRAKRALEMALRNEGALERDPNTTSGHLHRGVS